MLGVTQGLSEFLPISSSGHLILVPWLFGWKELTGAANADLNKTFDVALHVGTIVASLLYFRKDLARLARAGLTLDPGPGRHARPTSGWPGCCCCRPCPAPSSAPAWRA